MAKVWEAVISALYVVCKWAVIGIAGGLVILAKLVGDTASYVYDAARGTGESEKLKAEVGMDVKKS